jgi:hypothetical protein
VLLRIKFYVENCYFLELHWSVVRSRGCFLKSDWPVSVHKTSSHITARKLQFKKIGNAKCGRMLFRVLTASVDRQIQQQQQMPVASSRPSASKDKDEAVLQYRELGHRAVTEIQGDLIKVIGDTTTIQIFICSVMMVSDRHAQHTQCSNGFSRKLL